MKPDPEHRGASETNELGIPDPGAEAETSHHEPVFVVPITRELDLHSFRPRDIKFVVEDYVVEARAKGFREVRIVHGKGIGYQREVVRQVLASTGFVERFGDDGGNRGATIVWLQEQKIEGS